MSKKNYGTTTTTALSNDNVKNPTNDIFNKLKNRLPMFIINIYCTTTTLIYGDDMLTGVIQASDKNIFEIYYIFLCICAVIWDLWHAYEACIQNTTLKTNIFNKLCFCSVSMLISFLLFIITTNLVSFGLPFYIFFGFKKNNIILIYGSILPFLYFLDILEHHYWKANLDKYTEIEDADDIHSDEKLDITIN